MMQRNLPPRGPVPPSAPPSLPPMRPPVSPLASAAVSIGLVAGVLIGLPVAVVLIIFLWPAARAFGGALAVTIDAAPQLIGWLVIGSIVLAVLIKLSGGVAQVRRLFAQAATARVVKMQHGQPVLVDDLRPIAVRTIGQTMSGHYQALIEEARRPFPQLHSYVNHPVHHNDAPSLIDAEPAIEVGPLPLDEWLPWMHDQPHSAVAGATRKGKTTTAKARIVRWLEHGGQVFVIDPHYSDWLGLPVAGGNSREWDLLTQSGRKASELERYELCRALVAAFGEYQQRMAVREEHKKRTNRELPPGQFTPLLVVIDEASTIANLFPQLWALFLALVASGTRKVDISFLLLIHSPNVADLKITGAMRRNFAIVSIDHEGCQYEIDQIRTDKLRKETMHQLLPDLDWPAAAEIDGRLFFLDRTGMNRLPEPPDASAQAWPGWDYAAGRAAVSAPADAPTAAPRGTQSLVSASADLPTAIGDVRLAWLIAKMVDRQQPPDRVAAVLSSLTLRVAPHLDRDAAASEIARRAVTIAASGNAHAIAAKLDRDALIRACLDVGAGSRIAYAIWGGNSNQFYRHAASLVGE